MNELWVPFAVIVTWFVLNYWVLPKFGVQT